VAITNTIVRVKASTKTVFIDSLFVPKIIGIGPIIITPAASTFRLPAPRIAAKKIAKTIIMIQITITARPTAKKIVPSTQLSSSSPN
jgi:hypothetical protein